MTPDLPTLKRLAEAATPGPWTGDRYDGTVKYRVLAGEAPVVVGDNGNSDFGPYGILRDEDANYILAANPATLLALIAHVELVEALAKAAINYIEETPCDPDIFPAQRRAWDAYQGALAAYDRATTEGSKP